MAECSLIACDTTLNDKISELWSLILGCARFWIIVVLSSHTFPVSYDLNDITLHLLAFCNLGVTARLLIEVK